MLSIAAAVFTGHVSMVQFYVVAFATGTAYVFFSLSEIAAILSIVSNDQLPTAMAQNQAVGNGTSIISGPIGGVLFQLARPVPFLADGISFAASVISMAFVRTRFQTDSASTPPRNLGRELRQGLEWVFKDARLRGLAMTVAGWQLFNGFSYLTIILLATAHHAPPAVIGGIFALGAIGGFVGAVISPWVQRRFLPGLAFLSPLWLAALVWPLLLLAPNVLVIGGLNAVAQFFIPVGNTAMITYRAALIPSNLQGRVIGAYRVVVWGIIPLSTALGGLCLQKFGVHATIWIIFAGTATVCALATMNPNIRNAPPIEEVRVAG